MNRSFFARRSFQIMLVVVFLLPLIWAGTRRALRSNRNDVKNWLPDGFQETEDHHWFQAHFPHEQFVLVSWDGCTLDDQRLKLLAEKLVPPADAAKPSDEPRYFKKVYTGRTLVDEMRQRFEELSEKQVLKRLEGSLIGKDHDKTCLVVTFAKTYRGKELRAVLQKIEDTACKECGIGTDEIRMGGPPVDNAAIDYEGERTLMRLAGLSAIVGLGISWLCFRSIRLTAMIFSCAILAAGVGLSIVFFSGGLVDAILLSMPSLVYVLAMSGAIHIVNYYHDAVREQGLTGAPERALGHGWKPCTIAAVTTALGLISLYTSQLIPIRNFGLYSALGVLATLSLIFVLLPTCLYLWPSRQYAEQVARKDPEESNDSAFVRAWRAVGGVVIQHNVLVAIGCTAAMVFFAVGINRIETSVKLMKLFSPDAKIIAHYAWLEKHLGPLVPMEVVIRVDNEKCKLNFVQRMRLARDVERAVETLHDVGGALSAATFAPPLGESRLHYTVRDSVTSKRLERHRDDFREYLMVDEETNEELWRVSARVWALTDLDYGIFVDELRKKVEPVRKAYEDLGVAGISVTYTGLVPLVYKAQHELMRGLFNSLALAFVLIAVVMMLVLRSLSAGLVSMIPNLFPVVVIFGMMGWLGILVDVGSMMTASVALGVAVDDTIHYLSWFRDGLDRGKGRKGAAIWAYERCATAMTQTTIIGGLGLAVFAVSTFTPTQRFGYLMLAMLFAALIGDLIFLPALLSGPVGRFFDRPHKKRHLEPPPDEAADTPPGDLVTVPLEGEATTRHLRRNYRHRSHKAS